MKEIKIVSRWDNSKVLICGKYKSIKDCLEKNRGAYLGDAYLGGADLGGAYLGGADLRGAYLGGADLGGANLRGAYLGGAKNYYDNHDFVLEIIRRQPIKTFTDKEWVAIGQIAIYRFCWATLKKKYQRPLFSVCRKLAKAGFDEYLKHLTESQ